MTAAAFEQRLPALFDTIDSGDAEGFAEYLSDQASFRFGSAPTVQGRAAISEAVAAFFETIAGCSHHLSRTLVQGDVVICEGEVRYRRLDGSEVTLPFVDVFEMDGDLIGQYKIYMDISPLYAI